MKTRDELYLDGLELMQDFCKLNKIDTPFVYLLQEHGGRDIDRFYYVGTCAFYTNRPRRGDVLKGNSICIMVDKCAKIGTWGRAWSYPGYVIDRTPYGVLQHELGHAVDHFRTDHTKKTFEEALFSYKVYQQSKEKPLTGYLGTDKRAHTFYQEWFAEMMRLFVTNPNLLSKVRPKTFDVLVHYGLTPVELRKWEEVLSEAPERTKEQTRKKIDEAVSS